MNVRRKMLLIVTASILLTAVPGTLLIYYFAQQQVVEKESLALANEAERLVQPATRRFVAAGVKLPSLARLIQNELRKPDAQADLAAFHSSMAQDKYGIWRNKVPPYDGMQEAGIFLPPNPNQGDAQKVMHWRIKRVIDTFGAAATRKYENTWYLSPDRSEIIFDTTYPDFAIGMVPDNDYTSTPWVTYTTPELNPSRALRYTPPLFDPVPKVWMVSAIYPLYLGGQWLGTLGEDMQLSSVMGFLFESGELYSDTQHFLVDEGGHFVLAGKWQQELERNQETFLPDFSHEPALQALLETSLTDHAAVYSRNLELDGRSYIAIGMQLQPLQWHYFQLVPVDQVMASTRRMFMVLMSMILLVSLLSGVVIEFGVTRSIVERLQLLRDAMRRYGRGEYAGEARKIHGDDEIAFAAHAFGDMTEDIDRSVSERKAAEAALRASEERWKFALEGAGDGVWDWAVGSGELVFSRRWCEMIGYAEGEFPPTYDAWLAHLHEADRSRILAELRAYLDGQHSDYAVEFRMRCADGSYKWILGRGMVVARDDSGKPLRMIGTHTDISERKQAEEALELAALVYRISSEAMMITDAENCIVTVNPAFTEVTGYSPEEVIGRNPNILSSGRQDDAFYKTMWQSINETGHWVGELWNRKKDGALFAEHLTINTIFDDAGQVHRRIGLLLDVTDKKRSEEIIWRQANFDALTNLPNRRMFRDRLEMEMKKSARDKKQLALLFIDLDRFKVVNDTLGHHVGDDLLVEAATRLKSIVRETDTVARLGGDEFTVIFSQLEGVDDVKFMAQKLIEKLAEPYRLGSELAYVSASIGITLFPDDATQPDLLLQNADQAMYVAKDGGRNRFSFFTASLQAQALQRMRLLAELNQALDERQFQVHYQPVVTLPDRRIVKAEALVRWAHPQQGLISPAAFIPLAEETGLIVPLGDWVFREAMGCSKRWAVYAKNGVFQMGVNKSAVQFRAADSGMQDWVAVLREAGLPGHALNIEITETTLMSQDETTQATLLALRDAGIQVSVDDFGTGYSSLSYLKRLDIDFLKIDQSFIRNMVDDPSDFALCEAIVVMAHKLGLKVVAEGVETEGQHALLMKIGCDFGQGYLYGKPVPESEFESMLQAQAATPDTTEGRAP